jgi:hypothetical protein
MPELINKISIPKHNDTRVKGFRRRKNWCSEQVTDTKSYKFKKYTMKSEETRIHARGPGQESSFSPILKDIQFGKWSPTWEGPFKINKPTLKIHIC